jgi:hypothetical protein
MLLEKLVSFMLFQVTVISDVSCCSIVNLQRAKTAFLVGVFKVNIHVKEEFKVKNG